MLFRSFEVCRASHARFLDDAVQQDHPALSIHIEKYATDPVAHEISSDLVQAFAHRTAERHPDRAYLQLLY